MNGFGVGPGPYFPLKTRASGRDPDSTCDVFEEIKNGKDTVMKSAHVARSGGAVFCEHLPVAKQWQQKGISFVQGKYNMGSSGVGSTARNISRVRSIG